MKKIHTTFSNLSITSKILLLLVIFVVLPIILISGMIAYYMFSQEKKAEETTISIGLEKTAENVENQLSLLINTVDDLCFEDTLSDLTGENSSQGAYVNTLNLLDQTLGQENLFFKIQIFSNDGTIILQYGGESNKGHALSSDGNETYLARITQEGKTAFFSETHVMYELQNGSYSSPVQIVSYYHGIYDTATMSLNGVMAVQMLESSICDLYQNFLQSSPEASWIILKDGSLVSATEASWFENGIPDDLFWIPEGDESGSFLVTYEGQRMHIYWQKCEEMGVYILQMNRENLFLSSYMNFLLILIGLFLAIGVGFTLSYRQLVTKPLQSLAEKIDRAKRMDLKQEIAATSFDEIGRLTVSFQDMLCCIDDLIEKVYVERIKTQQAEKEALLSQINPHFLYNTLDSIRWNALAHGEKEIGAQIEALSMILRGTLNFGQMETTVRQECSIIENYCYLLKTRFRNEFQIEIDVDPRAQELCIPKLLIQPLVENAYKHGLENKLGEKYILVRILTKKDNLLIYVADNGLGCDCKRLRERLGNSDEKDCFALKNIRDRLTLSYKDRARFIFTSRPGRGTIVKLIIPLDIAEIKDTSNFIS